MATLVTDRFIDPGVGARRLENAAHFGVDVLGIDMTAGASQLADWAEAELGSSTSIDPALRPPRGGSSFTTTLLRCFRGLRDMRWPAR